MGGEQPPDSAATVVDAQENVSPTGDRTNESDVDDTLTSAKEKHAYAGLIRPREKAPRNSDLRHESQREPAGHSVVHTQKGAKNQRN
jgi:hypothetical protein